MLYINIGVKNEELINYINSTGRPIAFRNKKKSKHVFDHIKEVRVTQYVFL